MTYRNFIESALLILCFLLVTLMSFGQLSPPLVNQAGYNLGESKLKAALNMDWNLVEKGRVLLALNGKSFKAIEVTETGENTGIFQANFTIPANLRILKFRYGYLGFEKNALLTVVK